jgi:hypothetical protein
MSRRRWPGSELHVTPRQREILDLAVRALMDKEVAAVSSTPSEGSSRMSSPYPDCQAGATRQED